MRGARDEDGRYRDWLGLFFICLGLFVVTGDLSIVDAVLPDIVDTFGLQGKTVSLAISLYMLISACLLIPAGKLSDRIGARSIFAVAMLVFAVGSLICGLAPSFTLLIVGRVVQAVGYALTFPAALAVVNLTFQTGNRRTVAFSVLALTIGGALGGAPIIGEAFASFGGWNWAFTSHVPIVLLAMTGCLLLIGTTPPKRDMGGFDAAGLCLLILSQAMLFGGFQLASDSGLFLSRKDALVLGMAWPLPVSPALLLIAGALALAVLFVRIEHRRESRGDGVVLEVSIFRNPVFTSALVSAAAMTGGVFGVLYVLPLFFQYVLLSNLSGALIAGMGAGMVLGGVVAKSLVERYGPRRLTTISLGIQIVAVLLAAGLINDDMPPLAFLPGLFLQGAGWTLSYSVLQNTMLANVPRQLSAVASGTGLMGRLLAGALTTALIASVLFAVITQETRKLDMTALTPDQALQVRQIYQFDSVVALPMTSDGSTIEELRAQRQFLTVIEEAKDYMVEGLRVGLVISALLNLLGLIAGLRVWRQRQTGVPQIREDA